MRRPYTKTPIIAAAVKLTTTAIQVPYVPPNIPFSAYPVRFIPYASLSEPALTLRRHCRPVRYPAACRYQTRRPYTKTPIIAAAARFITAAIHSSYLLFPVVFIISASYWKYTTPWYTPFLYFLFGRAYFVYDRYYLLLVGSIRFCGGTSINPKYFCWTFNYSFIK